MRYLAASSTQKAALRGVRMDVDIDAQLPKLRVDEGRPLDVGRQRLASNQAVRLEFKRPWS